MIILVVGALMIVVGVSQLSFPNMVNSLRKYDHQQWIVLGSPPAYAFSKTVGVFSWILNRGYEKSGSAEVVTLGRKAYRKAVIVKCFLMAGIALVVVGFAATLIGVS